MQAFVILVSCFGGDWFLFVIEALPLLLMIELGNQRRGEEKERITTHFVYQLTTICSLRVGGLVQPLYPSAHYT